jgi:chromate reductase, NAD(P)H dehydrogenase (quinone)
MSACGLRSQAQDRQTAADGHRSAQRGYDKVVTHRFNLVCNENGEVTDVRVLLISGSTRAGSTNGAALATLRAWAPPGFTGVAYGGLSALPAFNPDEDREPLPAAVAELRAEIAAADALVFCTPEYAGTLPGSLKNLLDWTVGGTEISAKPVVWINVAATGRGRGAIATLETVLGYVGADLVQSGCIQLPVARDIVGVDGIITDPTALAGLAGVWTTLAAHLEGPGPA